MSIGTKTRVSGAGPRTSAAAAVAAANQNNVFLVTGGNGFLGSHVVSALKLAGFTVRVLCRSLPNVNQAVQGVQYIQGSVSQLEDIRKAAGLDVTGVFHLAGQVWHSNINAVESEQAKQVNVQGLMNVLQVVDELQSAANGKKKIRVVYASTSGVNACSAKPDSEADEKTPYVTDVVGKWPYYASKIEAEMLSRDVAKKKDIEIIYMRPSLLLGPGDERLTSIKIVYDFLNETIPFCPPGGVSFVDVRDAAQAFVNAMLLPSVSDSYMLSSCNCSIYDMFVILEKKSGVERPAFIAPNALITSGARLITFLNGLVFRYDPSVDPVFAEMGTHFWSCSSLRAQKEIEFSPRDPRKTLEDTIDWVKQNTKILQVVNSKPRNRLVGAKASYKFVLQILLLLTFLFLSFHYRQEIAGQASLLKTRAQKYINHM